MRLNNDQRVEKLATVASSPQPETVQYRDLLLRLAHRSLPLTLYITHTYTHRCKVGATPPECTRPPDPSFSAACECIWTSFVPVSPQSGFQDQTTGDTLNSQRNYSKSTLGTPQLQENKSYCASRSRATGHPWVGSTIMLAGGTIQRG